MAIKPTPRGANAPTTGTPTHAHPDQRRWRLVGQYATMEAAEQVARELRARGIESSVSLLGGLSVIARN